MIGPRETPGTGARRAAGPEANATRHRPHPAHVRLDAYGRYALILETQLAALDGPSPDLERFGALAEERAAVAREIDAAPPLEDVAELHDLIVRIRERVQRCQETDAAVLRRLAELRAETARALDGLETRRAGRAGYAGHAASPGGRSVDVTF